MAVHPIAVDYAANIFNIQSCAKEADRLHCSMAKKKNNHQVKIFITYHFVAINTNRNPTKEIPSKKSQELYKRNQHAGTGRCFACSHYIRQCFHPNQNVIISELFGLAHNRDTAKSFFKNIFNWSLCASIVWHAARNIYPDLKVSFDLWIVFLGIELKRNLCWHSRRSWRVCRKPRTEAHPKPARECSWER